MKSFVNRKLMVGATAVALLGGAGGAVAATQAGGTSSAKAYVSDVAARVGVSSSTLTTALKAAAVDQVNAAEAAGKISQARATKLDQRIEQGDGLSFLGRGLHQGGKYQGVRRAAVTAAAQYLGIPETTLRSDLKSGTSLAAVASSTQGKSVAGLEAAILAAETTRLNAAVAAGKITSAQEQARLTEISSRIDTIVNRTWSAKSGARSAS